ncbi:oxidoreductase [Salmonella enterica subsp. enterica]|uniref:Oxidoreductase n=1 Tax=Salmonella enterica I TaxID=59201 RepID=A0A379WBC4_SALET|nr:oxidoreductase [Salmonella enterica subsp. enterica]
MMHHYGSVLLPHGGSALVDMTYYENALTRHVAGQPAGLRSSAFWPRL